MQAGRRRRIPFLPTTSRGWWAVGLSVAGVLLVFAWSVLPVGAFPGFVLELAGGITALVAIIRDRERAITVYAALLPLVFVVVLVLAELIAPHG